MRGGRADRGGRGDRGASSFRKDSRLRNYSRAREQSWLIRKLIANLTNQPRADGWEAIKSKIIKPFLLIF